MYCTDIVLFQHHDGTQKRVTKASHSPTHSHIHNRRGAAATQGAAHLSGRILGLSDNNNGLGGRGN